LEKLILKKDSNKKVRFGHLWVFSNELVSIPKLAPGSVIELFDQYDKNYGKGFYNPNSLISVRLLKTNGEIDIDFFRNRILKAKSHREELLPELNNYRLVFGESDYLPGLIIDKFENSFVFQILSAGMELHKDMIKSAVLEIFPETDYILSKANSKLREMEGLELNDEILFGTDPGIIHTYDNGIKLDISLSGGQKTGYYLDQRFNRYEIRKFVKNKKILDCYTNQGGFALNACYAGADKVTAVDTSLNALELADNNAKLNGFNIDFVHSDVFDFLNEAVLNGLKWDVVILDPPAFTKNKKSIGVASAAYSKLNKLGFQVLYDGGYLVTSSCSQHITEEDFAGFIRKEASKQEKFIKLVYRGTQPADHPVLLSMPETSYLKFCIFKADNLRS